GSPATLQVSSPVTGQTYRWYEASTGGTPVHTGTSYTVNGLTANKTYYVEAVLGACPSARIAVDVVVNPLPALPQVTTTGISINAGQTATLSATTAAGNTIKWYANATGGTALVTANSYTTPALTTTTTYYVESVNAAGCPSATRVPVVVTV